MASQTSIKSVAKEIAKSRSLSLSDSVGGGSFKETFSVKDNSDAFFALKVYTKPELSERSKREIQAMIRCDHPNIAKILDVDRFESGGSKYLYLIEEYFDGGTMFDWLSAKGGMSRGALIEMGSHLISAIGHLHEQELVHRDIKPENILFKKNSNEPVLTDFGIARDLAEVSLTESWMPSGPCTPLYASPEQLNNQKRLIDWRTDQFCLAVTLSICFMQNHPYARRGYSEVKTIQNVAERGLMADKFLTTTKKESLATLAQMASAWPIRRIRTPDILANYWNRQG